MQPEIHETRDIDGWGLLKIAAAGIAGLTFVPILAAGLMTMWGVKIQHEAGPAAVGAKSLGLTAAPRLQTDEGADLASTKYAAAQRLNKYEWADEQKQNVHIPIERAMDLIVERGMPVWSGKVSGNGAKR